MAPSFHEALKQGKQVEYRVLRWIRQSCPKAYIKEGSFKDYDIFVPELGIGVEVKRDIKSQETGNFLIEIFHYGKPSALSVTRAKYWVIYDGLKYYWITPDKIREILESFKYSLREFIGAGDDTPKKAYLVPKNIIINESKDKWDEEIPGDKE